jgi:hypothetical protein
LSSYRLLFILCLSLIVIGAVVGQARPQYVTFRPSVVWLFENHDDYPYTIIDEMCYDDYVSRWCDTITNPIQIEIMVDWLGFEVGEVFHSDEGCFIWTYQPFWGEDGNPHINRHDWIICPLDF